MTVTIQDAARKMREVRRDRSYRSTPVGAVVGRYVRWMRNEQGSSENTITEYEGVLVKLAVDHADLTLDGFLPPIGTERLREFIDNHWGRYAASTRAKTTSILASFFRWCYENDLIDANPMLKIRRPKKRNVERHAHDPKQVRSLIASQPLLRDQVAIELMARLGLRKDELRTLQWKRINLRTCEIVVYAKAHGATPITIRPYKDLRLALEQLAIEEEARPDDYLLYPTRTSNLPGHEGLAITRKDRPMENSTMHRWWERCLHRSAVSYFPMHELRHTAITEFIRANVGDVARGQQFARHKSIQTTYDVYGHLAKHDLEEAMERAVDAWGGDE